jgi:hypothetical protein
MQLHISCPCVDYEPYVRPIASVPCDGTVSETPPESLSDETASLETTSSLSSSPRSFTPAISELSVDCGDLVGSRDVIQINSHPIDDFSTVIRTIVRPASPVIGCLHFTHPFSRPSSPKFFTRPSSPKHISRPSSPFSHSNAALKSLNCFSKDAFERDVDLIQARRPEVEVGIIQETLIQVDAVGSGTLRDKRKGADGAKGHVRAGVNVADIEPSGAY